MNKTHFEHIIYALLMQLPFGLFGYWWVGAALAIGFFAGREHAQAEERYIKANGGVRANAKWPEFGALQPKLWNIDSVLDFVAPAVCVVLIAIAAPVRLGL
jgi:hypothetical protein